MLTEATFALQQESGVGRDPLYELTRAAVLAQGGGLVLKTPEPPLHRDQRLAGARAPATGGAQPLCGQE
jgi:hypothetical protein